MNEDKQFIIGWNGYMKQCIVYSTVEHAERGGPNWEKVNAPTLKEAKEQFLRSIGEVETVKIDRNDTTGRR